MTNLLGKFYLLLNSPKESPFVIDNHHSDKKKIMRPSKMLKSIRDYSGLSMVVLVSVLGCEHFHVVGRHADTQHSH